MNRREKGLWGEQFAADWLQNHGYEILARNWRKGHGEIDIIARKEDIIAFVEVKIVGKNRRDLSTADKCAGLLKRLFFFYRSWVFIITVLSSPVLMFLKLPQKRNP